MTRDEQEVVMEMALIKAITTVPNLDEETYQRAVELGVVRTWEEFEKLVRLKRRLYGLEGDDS